MLKLKIVYDKIKKERGAKIMNENDNFFSYIFNAQTLTFYFIGVAIGMVLVALFFLIIYLVFLKKKAPESQLKTNLFSETELFELISKTQEDFIVQANGKNPFPVAINACKNMVNIIAKKFEPKSKRPLLELNLTELFTLVRIIVDKIEAYVSKHRAVSFLTRKVSISFIINIFRKKPPKEQKVSAFTKIKEWFSKTKDKAFFIAFKKLIKKIIEIVGVEVYNVYSKKAFLPQENLLLIEKTKKAGDL